MTELALLAAVAALVAGVTTSVLVPPLARLALAARASEPAPAQGGERAGTLPGTRSVPRIGGVAMAIGIALACGMGVAARWEAWSRVIPRDELLALGLGTLFVFLVGVVDDLVGVGPFKKFLVQFLAAWLIVHVGWSFHVLRLPLVGGIDLGIWGEVVSILWVVGVTNAINLLDGLDGLAGGVAAIISASLLAYALFQNNQGTAILFAAVCGACLGFLWHNWEPARVFLGDAGSLTLGYLFGALTLHSSLKAPAAVAILVPILALGLPVIDTLLVMLVRFADGAGRPLAGRFARMFRADRSHVHHALENLVRRRRRIVAVVYALVILFCLGALGVALSGRSVLGLALLAVEILAVLLVRRLGFAREAREISLEQRAEIRRRLPWVEEQDPSGEVEPAGSAGAGEGISRES